MLSIGQNVRFLCDRTIFLDKNCGIFFKGLANSFYLPYVKQAGNNYLRKSKKLWYIYFCAVVAQLVRALVCGTRGRRFESHQPYQERHHFCTNWWVLYHWPCTMGACKYAIMRLSSVLHEIEVGNLGAMVTHCKDKPWPRFGHPIMQRDVPG